MRGDSSRHRIESPRLRVAIVNEPFANRHFAGRSALGRAVQVRKLTDDGHWFTIVGVLKPIPKAACWMK